MIAPNAPIQTSKSIPILIKREQQANVKLTTKVYVINIAKRISINILSTKEQPQPVTSKTVIKSPITNKTYLKPTFPNFCPHVINLKSYENV